MAAEDVAAEVGVGVEVDFGGVFDIEDADDQFVSVCLEAALTDRM